MLHLVSFITAGHSHLLSVTTLDLYLTNTFKLNIHTLKLRHAYDTYQTLRPNLANLHDLSYILPITDAVQHLQVAYFMPGLINNSSS